MKKIECADSIVLFYPKYHRNHKDSWETKKHLSNETKVHSRYICQNGQKKKS